MKGGRLHMRRARQEGEGIDVVAGVCGMRDVQVTDDPGLVRCRSCRSALQRADRAADRAARDVERAERERERFLASTRDSDAPASPLCTPVEAVFEPSGPVPVLEVMGATVIDARSRRIIERVRSGDDPNEWPQWRSVRAAIRQTTAIKHGRSSIRSGFRIEQESRSEGAVRSEDGRDNLIEVDRAFARAFTADVEITRGTHTLSLTAHEARVIFEDVARDYRSATEWAERLTDVGRVASADLIGELIRIGMGEMQVELESKNLVEKRRRRTPQEVTPMAGDYEVVGWKRIAEVIDRTEGAARRYADREHDPLPVMEQLGRVVAKRSDLLAWLSRQTVARPTAKAG